MTYDVNAGSITGASARAAPAVAVLSTLTACASVSTDAGSFSTVTWSSWRTVVSSVTSSCRSPTCPWVTWRRTDQELTDLASTSGAGGEDLSPAAARVRAELGSASAPPMDALEFRLSEPNTVEDSDGMSWTRVEALRASPAADVFLSVLYICPSTAAKDLSDQEDLLLHRLEGLTVVAEP